MCSQICHRTGADQVEVRFRVPEGNQCWGGAVVFRINKVVSGSFERGEAAAFMSNLMLEASYFPAGALLISWDRGGW